MTEPVDVKPRNLSEMFMQQAPVKPRDPNEPPPRGAQCCGNCDAFVTMMGPLGADTACAAEPPKSIYLGMKPTQTVNPVTGQPQAFPVVIGQWPPTDENRWCRSWKWRGPENDA